MPAAYIQIRDRFIKKGDSRKEAESRAAAIFNGVIAPKTHQPFVTGKPDRKKGGKKP